MGGMDMASMMAGMGGMGGPGGPGAGPDSDDEDGEEAQVEPHTLASKMEEAKISDPVAEVKADVTA